MGIACNSNFPRRRGISTINSNDSSYINSSKKTNSYYENSSQRIQANDFAKKINKKNISNGNINNSLSQLVLNNHNKIRRKYRVNNLELNDELNELAQKYSDKCAETESFDHYPFLYKGEVIGENIKEIKDNNFDVSTICDNWNNEEEYFDFNNPIFKSDCRHFTQIIWKDTKYVGFGISTSSSGKKYFVAFYFPAGNIFDKFKENIGIPQ